MVVMENGIKKHFLLKGWVCMADQEIRRVDRRGLQISRGRKRLLKTIPVFNRRTVKLAKADLRFSSL